MGLRTILHAVASCILLTQVLSIPMSESSQKKSADLNKSAARVVNGVPVTDKDEYPFVVDLSAHETAISSSRFCTGTTIKPDVILTAAHCVLNDGYSSPVYATIGRIELNDGHNDNKGAQTFRTIASIVHPEYQGLGSSNDVALMLLNDSSTAPTVKLAEETPRENEETWVVGYGIQKIGTLEESGQNVEIMSGRLQKTALRIKGKEFCDIPGAGFRTQKGMLCTAGVNKGSSACKGDSGGGLFLQRGRRKSGEGETAQNKKETVQVGVVSYGDSKCMSEDSGVFTDVASVKDWIQLSSTRLRKAFHSVRIRMDDKTANDVIHHGTTVTKEGNVQFLMHGMKPEEHAKLYRLHTNFKKPRKLTVSLCDGPPQSQVRLLVTNDKDGSVLQDNGSCPGGKLSKLSFAAKHGNFIIGVSGNGAVPFKLAVSAESV